MEATDLKRVLAGFGLATLLAGVALAGCKDSQKSTGSKSGAGGTESQKVAPAPSS